MKKPLSITFDCSILGSGHINPKARTGIFRAVEQTLLALLQHPDIELNLTCLNSRTSFWYSIATQIYFRDNNLDGHAVSAIWSKLLQYPISGEKWVLENFGHRFPLLVKLAIALQIPIDRLSRLLRYKLSNPLKTQIYHSPYFPLPEIALSQQVPRVLTIYDLVPIRFPELCTGSTLRQFHRTLKSIDIDRDWIICISEHTKKDFCESTQMNTERVFVTPLAVSNNFYPVNDSDLIKKTLKHYKIDKSPYFLSLCTLEPRKNLSFLIKCFSKVIFENPNLDINLVLVGVSGWKNKAIFIEAESTPLLKSRVIFTGYVPDQDLSAIYSGALAFVYPSLYEGFGLPPLEAMQCGTPVITSNTSSLPEVVGDAGIMINPTQEDELCHALFNMINDSNVRETLSKKGLERSSQFSWSKCAEKTVNVYRFTVENKNN